MDLTIMDATADMLSQLEELERSCFSVPWTKEMLKSQLPDNSHCFLAARYGEHVIGYVGMMHVLDEGYISNVAVSPEVRRTGVGDRLITALLERCKALSLSFVTLEVRESNSAAIALYEKHGFQPVGMRKNYYERPKENAILMTKLLK